MPSILRNTLVASYVFFFNIIAFSQSNLLHNGNMDELGMYKVIINDQNSGVFEHSDTFMFRHSLNKGVHPVRLTYWDEKYAKLGRYSEESGNAASGCCYILLPFFEFISKNAYCVSTIRGVLKQPLVVNQKYHIKLKAKVLNGNYADIPLSVMFGDSIFPNSVVIEKNEPRLKLALPNSPIQKINVSCKSKLCQYVSYQYIYTAKGNERYVYLGFLDELFSHKYNVKIRESIRLAIDDVEVIPIIESNKTAEDTIVAYSTDKPIFNSKFSKTDTFLNICYYYNSDEYFSPTNIVVSNWDSLISVNKISKIMVCGHTDSTGNKLYNDTLSYNRASTFYDKYLNTKVCPVEVVGLGYSMPIENKRNSIMNRRVEVILLKEQ